MKLNDIVWGSDSAENDPNLLGYFYDSVAFKRLSERRKLIVIGRKGAGKSALRAKLAQHFGAQEDTYVITVSPSYQNIRAILNEKDLQDSFGQEVFFQHTWLRQILTDCLAAVGHGYKGRLANDSIEFARTVAKQLNRTSKDLVENIVEILNRVKAKVGELGEFGLSLEKELRNVADVDALEHHALLIAKNIKFVILIDDLDQGWDNSRAANQLLLGLLLAATTLNGKSANIFPIIFLREDVYALLMPLTQHADKYRDIEEIRWDNHELRKVLESRIGFNRGQHSAGPVEDLFHSVFPETIGTSNTMNWLVERTLSRPRELIQLARRYTEFVDGSVPSDALLKASESTYSEWKLSDLCAEFSNQYPGLALFFREWKSIYPRAPYHFKRNEFDDVLLNVIAAAQINEAWFNDVAQDINLKRMTEVLFEIGFLGDYVAGGSGGGARTVYAYQGPHQPRFDEVQIHPCFRRAIDTAERRKRVAS